MPQPMLELRDLDCGYGPITVVSGLSMAVEQGAVVALLGANGAGKSTILRAISGTLVPQRGSIVFNGSPIGGRAPDWIVQQGLSHVPEGRELFAGLTVRENLLMGAYTRPRGHAVQTDLQTVLDHFPILGERLGQAAGMLSGGQQQMLAIGRALMARPRMLLLDEPSLGLSPKIVKEIFAILARINREDGVTILLVEQNASVALDAAGSAYVLELGRIASHGTSDEFRRGGELQELYLGRTGGGTRRQSEQRRPDWG